MMKKWKKIIGVIGTICAMCISGCTAQQAAKNYGGSTTIELPVNQKLEENTWKDDSLWYLIRPMTENDIVETHTFQQSSSFGIFEGTVTIIESKSE